MKSAAPIDTHIYLCLLPKFDSVMAYKSVGPLTNKDYDQ